MRKIILLMSILISTISAAQIKVTTIEKAIKIGEVAPMGSFLAEITKRDYIYFFMYKDMNYQQLFELKTFKIKESDLEDVYKLFSEVGDAKEGETKIVDLGTGDKLSIYYVKQYGKIYFSIYHQDKSGISGLLPGFTAKQLKKLFGKNN